MNGYKLLLPVIALLSISAYAQELNEKDRAFLWETRTIAQSAKDESAKATENSDHAVQNANFAAANAQKSAEDADKASEAAAVAAAAAQASSDKSDRIFRHNLGK